MMLPFRLGKVSVLALGFLFVAGGQCLAMVGWADNEILVSIAVGETTAIFDAPIGNDLPRPVTLDAVVPECSCISVVRSPSVLEAGKAEYVRMSFSLGTDDISVQKVVLVLGDGARSILRVKAVRSVPVAVSPRVILLSKNDERHVIRVAVLPGSFIRTMTLSCGANSVKYSYAKAVNAVNIELPFSILPENYTQTLIATKIALADNAVYDKTIIVYDRAKAR